MSLKEKTGCRVLIISMDDSEAGSLERMRAFLAGSGGVRFAGQRREEVCGWTERTGAASRRQPEADLQNRRTDVRRLTGSSGWMDSKSIVWIH